MSEEARDLEEAGRDVAEAGLDMAEVAWYASVIKSNI
jgi:hypothetical protein